MGAHTASECKFAVKTVFAIGKLIVWGKKETRWLEQQLLTVVLSSTWGISIHVCAMNKCHKLVMSSFQLVSLPAFHFRKSGDTDLMVSTAIIKLISALFRSTERLNNPPSSTTSEPLPCASASIFMSFWQVVRSGPMVYPFNTALPSARCAAERWFRIYSTFLALSLLKEGMFQQGLAQCSVPPVLQKAILAGTLYMHSAIRSLVHIFVPPVTSLEGHHNKGLKKLICFFKYRY